MTILFKAQQVFSVKFVLQVEIVESVLTAMINALTRAMIKILAIILVHFGNFYSFFPRMN